jgi:hypothetical protein
LSAFAAVGERNDAGIETSSLSQRKRGVAPVFSETLSLCQITLYIGGLRISGTCCGAEAWMRRKRRSNGRAIPGS